MCLLSEERPPAISSFSPQQVLQTSYLHKDTPPCKLNCPIVYNREWVPPCSSHSIGGSWGWWGDDGVSDVSRLVGLPVDLT